MAQKTSNDLDDFQQELLRRFKIAIEFLTELGKLEEYNKRIGIGVATPMATPNKRQLRC
jgi:hypothetical protein